MVRQRTRSLCFGADPSNWRVRSEGYSIGRQLITKNNASKIGSELLGKTRVFEAIQKEMQDREQRTQITQDMVVRELAKVAFHHII